MSQHPFTVSNTYLLSCADYLLPSLYYSHLSLKSCTITVQLAITEMRKGELLLLKFHVKCRTESQESSKWSNSSMSQSRHCKHKATKYRDVIYFRLSKRRNLPSRNCSLQVRYKGEAMARITTDHCYMICIYKPLWDHHANYCCVILRRIIALILAVSNIYPYGNLNIFTPLPFPDISARGQYMENLILHVLCMPKHKRLHDC